MVLGTGAFVGKKHPFCCLENVSLVVELSISIVGFQEKLAQRTQKDSKRLKRLGSKDSKAKKKHPFCFLGNVSFNLDI